MSHSHQREVAVFEAALKLPPEQRSSYLEQTCAGDLHLLQRVEALLRAEDQPTGFLETVAPAPMLPVSERAGDRIGPYKLLEQIGEGGCGVVYMAEQETPIRRRVALKIIKLGMDTKQVIARFEAERQALALMDHPNIAKVHDAGATATGRPYFVMELVRGLKITEYCDEKKLTTRQRLELFIQVCQAVQHAHQKGIIHRDLKPSNVLVSFNDGEAVAKVIDFGIAKATSGERLTDKTVFTAFEQFMGTPAYMSPEQAEMTSLDIDTRSDIYSLGVLLYELLTGRTPFTAGELLRAGLEEMRRTIREEQPIRPSARLVTLAREELTTTANQRCTEPPKLVETVRDDLDWIALKCLEKDRRRRYQTATELSTDVQRHLHSEPVSARPPSRLYEFKKIVHRHKVGFAAAAVITVFLLAGIAVSTVEASRARRAEAEQVHLRRKAEAGEEKANTEATTAQQVAQLLQDVLSGVGPEVAKGRDATIVREILDQGANKLGNSLTNQPLAKGSLLLTMAWMYKNLGEYVKAEQLSRQGLEVGKVSFGETNELVAKSLGTLGAMLMYESRLPEAEIAMQRGLAMSKQIIPDDKSYIEQAVNNLAMLLDEEARYPESETLYRESFDLSRDLYGEESANICPSLNGLSNVLRAQGKNGEAEIMLRKALSIIEKVSSGPNEAKAFLLMNLAGVLQAEDKLTDAEAMAKRGIISAKFILGAEHPDVAFALKQLGEIQIGLHNIPEAENNLQEALAICRKRLGDQNPNTIPIINDLANVLNQEKKSDEAARLEREALIFARSDANTPRGTNNLVVTLHNLAFFLLEDEKPDHAEPFLWEALAILEHWSPSGSSEPPPVLDQLARSLYMQAKWDKYSELINAQVLSIERDPTNQSLRSLRISGLARLGRWDECAAAAQSALEMNPTNAGFWQFRACALVAEKKLEAYYSHCQEMLRRFGNTKDPIFADPAVKDCLILPNTNADLLVISNLAQVAVNVETNHPLYWWTRFCFGLAEYRMGRFANAKNWMRKTLKGEPEWEREFESYMVLAMAEYQLGEVQEAQSAFAAGKAIETNHFPNARTAPYLTFHDPDWPDWVIGHALEEEAEALLQAKN